MASGVTAGRDSRAVQFLSPPLTRYGQSLRDPGIARGAALLASMPADQQVYRSGMVGKAWPLEFSEGTSDASDRLRLGPAPAGSTRYRDAGSMADALRSPCCRTSPAPNPHAIRK